MQMRLHFLFEVWIYDDPGIYIYIGEEIWKIYEHIHCILLEHVIFFMSYM